MFYATFDFVSLHSQASSIVKFNGLNFPEWSEQVQFHLGVLDLDLTLLTDKPTAITETSSAEQRSFHKTCCLTFVVLAKWKWSQPDICFLIADLLG